MATLQKITHHKETNRPHRAEIRLTATELATISSQFAELKRAYDEDNPFGDDRSPLEVQLDEARSELERQQREFDSVKA